MKQIYIAGPFRAANHWEIKKNVYRAEELSAEVWKLRVVAVCPHKNTENFQGMVPDEVFIEGTLEMLSRCDGILMLPDWKKSEGARDELKWAVQHGMPVFHNIDELKEWLTVER